MSLCLEVMEPWEWNKREKVITDTTSKSVCGINLIKGLPTQWFFFSFAHKREVLRSTPALSRQIDWITHKKITPFVRVSVTNLEGQRGWIISNSICHSQPVSCHSLFFFFRMANMENNVVTLTVVGYSTTLIIAVVLGNRYQYFSSKQKMEIFRAESRVALLILPS